MRNVMKFLVTALSVSLTLPTHAGTTLPNAAASPKSSSSVTKPAPLSASTPTTPAVPSVSATASTPTPVPVSTATTSAPSAVVAPATTPVVNEAPAIHTIDIPEPIALGFTPPPDVKAVIINYEKKAIVLFPALSKILVIPKEEPTKVLEQAMPLTTPAPASAATASTPVVSTSVAPSPTPSTPTAPATTPAAPTMTLPNESVFAQNLQSAGITFQRTASGVDVMITEQKVISALPMLTSHKVIPKLADKDVHAQPVTITTIIGITFTVAILEDVYTKDKSVDKIHVQAYSLPGTDGDKQPCYSFDYTRADFEKLDLNKTTPKNFAATAPGFNFNPWCKNMMDLEAKAAK